jgi:hypothetical protein
MTFDFEKQDSFLDAYNAEKDKDKLRKEAISFFNDKYYKNPFGDYWIIEQTERFRAKKLRFFMPGRIYTFQYMNPHTKDLLEFYDKRPMIYVIGEYVSPSSGYNILQGINLNFLPERAKASFINTAFNVFKDAYIVADDMSDKDRFAYMKTIVNFITDWNFMTQNFDKQGKIGLSFATRNYDIAGIQQPVLIEVEDFPMVPYFVPKEFAGKPPAFVYQLYLKSRNKILASSAEKNKDAKRAKDRQKRFKKPGG